MSKRLLIIVMAIVAVLVVLALLASCAGQPLLTGGRPTPQHTDSAPAVALDPSDTSVPPATSTTRPTRTPTATAVAGLTPTALRVRTATPTATAIRRLSSVATVEPSPTAPTWPIEISISDGELTEMADTANVQGLTLDGFEAQVLDGTLVMQFDRLRYGFVSVREARIEGHLEVQDGQVSFVADRIQPRNLVTSAIPAFINQSLAQATGEWYVEDARLEPGQLVLVVRPR